MQLMWRTVTLVVLVTVIVHLEHATLAGASTVDQQQPNHSGLRYLVMARVPYGQSFTAGLNGTVDRVDLYLSVEGSPSVLRVQIFGADQNGFPTGGALSTGIVKEGTTGGSWIPVSLQPGAAMKMGLRYVIVLSTLAEYTRGGGAWVWASAGGDVYAGGSGITFYDGRWLAYLNDMAFITYVTAPSPDASAATIRVSLSPPLPNGTNGWYISPVTVSWTVTAPPSGIAASSGCDTTILSADTSGTGLTCSVTNGAGLTSSQSVIVKIDKTPPTIAYGGNVGWYLVDQTVNITCTAADATSGISSTTCHNINDLAGAFKLGTNTLTATATDGAGNVGNGSTSFTVWVTFDSLCRLTQKFIPETNLSTPMCQRLSKAQAAAAVGNVGMKTASLSAYRLLVAQQNGRTLTAQRVDTLSLLSNAL